MITTEREAAPSSARRLLMWLPPVLVACMSALFLGLARLLGSDAGYVVAFVLYWLACLTIPAVVLGPARVVKLLRPSTVAGRAQLLPAAIIALIVVGTIASYGPSALRAPALLLVAALPIAMVNGVCEELLWRGLFVRVFGPGPWLAVVYPAIWFGLWHVAPQLVFPSPTGVAVLIVLAGVLGFCYGWVTLLTGSARWAAVSHGVSGVIAMGGAIAPAVLRLLHVD